jgi:type VI secretion system protein ImpA
MPSPDVIDFAKLLAPIPGDSPTGIDFRGSSGANSPYYQVKDARTAARGAERQIENGSEDVTPPDWKLVVANATKALADSTKDLEIAAYLIEAQARVNGFAGLRDGFKLVAGLIEAYWDNLFPVPDEEGVATKVAALTGLNGDEAEGTLIAPINRIPLTDSGNHGRLHFGNYMQAQATNKVLDPKVKEKKIASGAMSLEKYASAVEETPAPYYRLLHDDLIACIEEFSKLSSIFDAKCGPASPPSSAIRASLTAVLDAIKDIARGKLAMTQTVAPTEADKNDDGTPGSKSADGDDDDSVGIRLAAIRNREDALNAVLQLADYFRVIEPHSIVPFALEQSVRWGRLPLVDLMAELIPDDGPRKALFKQVGIRQAEANAKNEK